MKTVGVNSPYECKSHSLRHMKNLGATAKEVRDYLNRLTEIKKNIKFPMNLDIDEGLYTVMDGDGKPVITLTEDVYKVFQEL